MEKIVTLLVPALLTILLVRVLLLPLKAICKIAIHSGCGFVCLWLLNTITPFTGIAFPMNAITVLIAGILGLPGIGLLAILAVM
jgi:inhibitor of the pro-sigma K processing machinery